MKPILFPENETQFNTNGLGRLADATSCLVTEERNGSYELEMDYPITGLHYSDIQMSGIIYAKPADGKTPQAFRIYKIGKPINGIVTINAEHISYQLSHIPVGPFEAETVADALLGLSQNAAETCPFTFWTDKTTIASFSVKQPVSIRSQLGGVQGSILDVYGGGDYEFDMYTVKLHQNRGFDRGVTLRYGKNITDIKQEENIRNTYTGVMPFWKNGQDDDATLVMLTEKVLHSANASNFPYQRTIPLDLSSEWQEEPTEAQLRAKATAYMTANNIGVPAVSIDVDFVALWQTEEYKDIANLERVNLCDTVMVEFPKLDISATAKVVKTTYDVLSERYRTIELGEARNTLSKSISADIRGTANAVLENVPSESFIKKSIDRATELLRGGLGGYVVMSLNANGEPQELLIMDTPDIQTAINVIRINRNGIGFSSNGYEGPFTSAWTIDGHFVADFIDTGNLNASLITTGTMQADRILGGTMRLGGVSNQNGVLVLTDANGVEIGRMDNTGFTITGDITMLLRIYDQYGNIVTKGSARMGQGTFYPIGLASGFVGASLNIKNAPSGTETFNNTGVLKIAPTEDLINNSVIYSNRRLELQSQLSDNGDVVRLILDGSKIWFDYGPQKTNVYSQGVAILPSNDEIDAQNIEVDTISAYSGSNVTIDDNLIVRGSKPRGVDTPDYGMRLLYAYETPSPMFGDIGQGVLDDEGICYIDIDDIFDETVRTDIEYQVFLQAEGEGTLYVAQKEKTFFVVRGTPGLSFAWELKARQRDYELIRMEGEEELRSGYKDLTVDEIDYETQYYEELLTTIEEQEEMLYETA